VEVSVSELESALTSRSWEIESLQTPCEQTKDAAGAVTLTLEVEAIVRRCGREKKVLVPDHFCGSKPMPNARLIKLVTHSHAWFRAVTSGEVGSINELSDQLKRSRTYVSNVIKVALLAPDITESILAGTQPIDLKSADLLKNLPMDWSDQRRVLEFKAQ
jgi:site-specific DNA recombinase